MSLQSTNVIISKFSSGKYNSNNVRKMSFEIEIRCKKYIDIWMGAREIDYQFIDSKSIQLAQRCVSAFKSSSIFNFLIAREFIKFFSFHIYTDEFMLFLQVEKSEGSEYWMKRMDTNFIKDVLSIGLLKFVSIMLCFHSPILFCTLQITIQF